MSRQRFSVNGLILVISMLSVGQAAAETVSPLSDPTRPQGWRPADSEGTPSGGPSIDGLRLQGTFSVAGQRSAMISGQRVIVGDEVSGARVIEIDSHKVVLSIDGQTVELASLLPPVKAPTKSPGRRQ
ncbi:MAG: general secretion pathway protein GspB [Sedimenticolaceae bacterium]